MNLNIFSDLRKSGLVPGESLSLSTNINSVLEKNQIYIKFFVFRFHILLSITETDDMEYFPKRACFFLGYALLYLYSIAFPIHKFYYYEYL